jgi:para-nitrobenzyl esterase
MSQVGSRWRPIVGLAVLAAAVGGMAPSATAAPAGAVAGPATAARTGGTTVRVADGALRGTVTPQGRRFAGIPYAAPPVGNLRWKAPAPAAPWTGVRDASQFGAACAQLQLDPTIPAGQSSEDCLTLNVYTPPGARRSGPLPVMVWIHGGGFVTGAGSGFDSGLLAATGDVIVVTINYRLGVFGFLVHPALDAGAPAVAGDYGLADQQAALRWVRRNVGAFGGDRRNVTIFGESAGAGSVCSHVASPTAAGLFARALAESGCTGISETRSQAAATGAAVAAAVGCTDAGTAAACLRARPTGELLTAVDPRIGANPSVSFAPTAGVPILPRDVPVAFATGRFNHVPLLNGTNHDEGRGLLALVPGIADLTAAAYPGAIAARYGPAAPAVLAAYPADGFALPVLALAATITDSTFTCPALDVDRTLAARVPTYGYEFNDPDPPQLFPAPFPLAAAHGSELGYVFGHLPGTSGPVPFTPAQARLSDQMMRYWTRFARTGTPNLRGAPHWPAVRTGQLLSLDPAGPHPLTVAAVGADHHCALWTSLAQH